MCGIAGIYGLNDLNTVKKMTRAIQHRGPDDEGFYIDENISLGHRRLSIIDLQGGKQPIFNEDKSVVIIFNGEIYNYKELRKRLIENGHEFYTQTDTEIIVHMYEEQGLNFVKNLNGMFAFALYDVNKKKLILARDHAGIKPLFYTKKEGKLIFGSEIKAIFNSGIIAPHIDMESLKEKHVFGHYMLDGRTLFRGIKQLLPGHIIVVTGRGERTLKYNKKSYPNNLKDENIGKNSILKLLRESVKARLMSDVPLGTFLSGGLDSSTIATLHRELVPDKEIHTFSITDDSYSEDSKKARIVAEHINSNHHEFVFSTDELMKNMPAYVYHEEDTSYGIIYSFVLCRLTKKYVTVALSGNGSDEIFAGYDRLKDIGRLKSTFKYRLEKTNPNIRNYNALINSIKTKQNLLEFEQQRGQLCAQLKWADRFSMAYGLEARVPFLDKKLLDFANKISMKLKIRNGVEKYILREAISKLNMPDIIRKRPKVMGGNATSMPKAIPEYEKYCEKLMSSRKRKPYDNFFDKPAKIITFDLLNHIFIDNGCQAPNDIALNDLY